MLTLWLVVSSMILLACCLIIFATINSNNSSNLALQAEAAIEAGAEQNFNNKANKRSSKNFVLSIVLIVISVATMLLYRLLGSSYEIALTEQFNADISAEKFYQLIEEWANNQPNNERANWLLAKQQMLSGDNIAAERTYHKLIKLNANEGMYWSELAELLFYLSNNQSISAEIRNYYQTALRLNPQDSSALELQGNDYFSQQEYNKAKLSWKLALQHTVNEKNMLHLKTNISYVRQLLGEYLAKIEVEISIDASIANELSASNRIFLFAQEPGNSIPLAVTTITVNKLPTSLILHDSSVSMNNQLLSEVDQVDIIARINTSQADPKNDKYEVIINNVSTLKSQHLKIKFTKNSMIGNKQ